MANIRKMLSRQFYRLSININILSKKVRSVAKSLDVIPPIISKIYWLSDQLSSIAK
jgi:hypothetical protein